MKKLLKNLLLTVSALLVAVTSIAQVTTSSMDGFITDENGEALAGAAVIAVHVPSGTQYFAIANAEGRYVINGMRTGGPYKVEISFIGMTPIEFTDVVLKLGEPYELDATMKSSTEAPSDALSDVVSSST